MVPITTLQPYFAGHYWGKVLKKKKKLIWKLIFATTPCLLACWHFHTHPMLTFSHSSNAVVSWEGLTSKQFSRILKHRPSADDWWMEWEIKKYCWDWSELNTFFEVCYGAWCLRDVTVEKNCQDVNKGLADTLWDVYYKKAKQK